MASIHRRMVRWTTQEGHKWTGQRWQTRDVGEDVLGQMSNSGDLTRGNVSTRT